MKHLILSIDDIQERENEQGRHPISSRQLLATDLNDERDVQIYVDLINIYRRE